MLTPERIAQLQNAERCWTQEPERIAPSVNAEKLLNAISGTNRTVGERGTLLNVGARKISLEERGTLLNVDARPMRTIGERGRLLVADARQLSI